MVNVGAAYKKSELQILELAPECRYSVLDHPYSSTQLPAEPPLPLLGSLAVQTKSSGLPLALQQRTLTIEATPPYAAGELP